MRTITTRLTLALIVLVVGVVIGATVPRVPQIVHGALAAVGLASGSARPAPASKGKAEAGPSKAAAKGDHAEEGVVKMEPEQVSEQDIAVTAVGVGILGRHLIVPGTITPNADRIARVPARVVGTVAEMRKRLGDPVQRGEVVAVLDSREVADAKSEYLTAMVKADLERINFERQQGLWDKRISAEAAFLTAKAVYSEAALRQDLARQKLSALGLNAAEVASSAKKDETTPNLSSLRQYELRSPLAGRVVERKVDVGTAVGKEGDPADLYTVADLSVVWIELAVPTVELSKVKEGEQVFVTPSQGDEAKRAEGKVIFVSPLLNPDTRSARVIVSLPNPNLSWRPGTFVTAEVEVGQDKVAVRVPKSALQTIEGKRVVFVRTPEGFRKQAVEIGRSDDEAFEVVSGLPAGAEIAVKNTFLLKAELGKAEAEHGD